MRPLTYFICALILSNSGLLCAQQSSSDALQRWMASSGSHASYKGVEKELSTLFAQAEMLSLPTELLIRRLNLAVARRLPPEVVVSGIREEVSRLHTSAELLSRLQESREGRQLVSGVRRADFLGALSIYLSGGLSESLLLDLLDRAATLGKSADDAFRVCAVVLQVEKLNEFDQAVVSEFGLSLLSSKVDPSGYGAVGSFIARAAATKRGGDSLLREVSRILRQGGGLPQMELELGRRR